MVSNSKIRKGLNKALKHTLGLGAALVLACAVCAPVNVEATSISRVDHKVVDLTNAPMIVPQANWEGIPDAFLASLKASDRIADYDTNINYHSYRYARTGWVNNSNYAEIVTSYLSYSAPNNTYMALRNLESGVYADYFDGNFNFLGQKKLPEELPKFGAFLETPKYYFVVTGKDNPDEVDGVELVRVVKYDKAWNKLASLPIYAHNTVSVFGATGVTMLNINNSLVIRTGHRMFKRKDGRNHQCALNYEVDIEKMKLVSDDEAYYTGGSKFSLASHSFNQLIDLDKDDNIVMLDHGDAYPRYLKLEIRAAKYNDNVITPTDGGKDINMFNIVGNVGDNHTGVMAGGLLALDEAYLVAGTSVQQDADAKKHTTRNVFLSVYNRKTGAVDVKWITNFPEGETPETTCTNPYLLKVGPNANILLWSKADTIYYQMFDDLGNAFTQIKMGKGQLSDCQPIGTDSLRWYTTDGTKYQFYGLNLAEELRNRGAVKK